MYDLRFKTDARRSRGSSIHFFDASRTDNVDNECIRRSRHMKSCQKRGIIVSFGRIFAIFLGNKKRLGLWRSSPCGATNTLARYQKDIVKHPCLRKGHFVTFRGVYVLWKPTSRLIFSGVTIRAVQIETETDILTSCEMVIMRLKPHVSSITVLHVFENCPPWLASKSSHVACFDSPGF